MQDLEDLLMTTVYDKNAAIKCFGEEAIFQAAASTFLDEIDVMLDLAADSVSSCLFEEVKEKAHWIKGGLIYLHAAPSAAAAKALEDAARDKQDELLGPCLSKLREEIEKLKSCLKRALEP